MPAISRRGLLLGAAASAVLTACRAKRAPERTPSADERARAAAAEAERALVDEYDTALAAHPDLAARLEPLVDHHRRHLAALGAPGSPTPTPSTGTATPPALALRSLAGLEVQLSARHRAALGAVSAELALLLASLAASASANAAELERKA